MLQLVRENLNRFVSFTDPEFEEFTTHLKRIEFRKNEFLLRQGDICRHGYFIVSGAVRYFFLVNGEERTGQFFFESSWYTDLESFLSGEPSEQNIQAVEPGSAYIISKQSLLSLYDKHHSFERFGRLLVEHGFMGLRKKNKVLTNLSAEERYLDLIKTRPKVIDRIPQQYIASYLGIKPESLSRIRKRIYTQRKQKPS